MISTASRPSTTMKKTTSHFDECSLQLPHVLQFGVMCCWTGQRNEVVSKRHARVEVMLPSERLKSCQIGFLSRILPIESTFGVISALGKFRSCLSFSFQPNFAFRIVVYSVATPLLTADTPSCARCKMAGNYVILRESRRSRNQPEVPS